MISLTLGAQVYPVMRLLPWLVPVSLLLTGSIAVRDRAAIDRALIVRRVLPLMAGGAALGVAIANAIGGLWLRRLFGVLVVVLAARALWQLLRRGCAAWPRDGAAGGQRWAILGAGLIHGIYACGGPLLVYGIGAGGLSKRGFRATLCAIFFTLNLTLSFVYMVSGRLHTADLARIALLAPVVLLALAAGGWLHARVDERRFRGLVYALLLFAGGALVGR